VRAVEGDRVGVVLVVEMRLHVAHEVRPVRAVEAEEYSATSRRVALPVTLARDALQITWGKERESRLAMHTNVHGV
jgi:hypothetical protein